MYYYFFFNLLRHNSHNPNCVWVDNQKCQDRSSATTSSYLCKNNNHCRDGEICVALRFSADPCLADSLGQCIRQPNVCPSNTKDVCGCDGTTYKNECECLKSGENIKYEGACSADRDRDFRRDVLNLDDYREVTNDLLWQFMYSSVSTDGTTCMTLQECKKHHDINHRNSRFKEVEDPYNCGCYEWNGYTYWSDHNNCSDKKKKALSLQNSRVRAHCDLNRIYQAVRNVPTKTCLEASECDRQCYHDNLSEVKIKTDPDSGMCGCYSSGNQCYYNANACNGIYKPYDNLTGGYQRVWCEDRIRSVRDVVDYTCYNRALCEEQGVINGDVKTPALVKDFDSDNICGCYAKGGQLYWAKCDEVTGDFYRELNNQKERIYCEDVQTRSQSYRVFNQQHSHLVSILLFFFQTY
jgi:hypothetical protein